MLELIASSTFGLESIVKDELWKLGFEIINVENGQISFRADFYGLAKANLWLRCAERVFLKMGEFPARDFDELYDNTRNLPWEEWLPVNANFPVTGKSVKSVLHSVPACQSIIKKAIVDRLKDKYRKDSFEEDGPLYPVYFALYKDRITLSINTSGEGLHKRGYRELSAEAPLQETLAAAILYLSRWQPDRILTDPFCGSGTIPVEAALIGQEYCPGSVRRRFVLRNGLNWARKSGRKPGQKRRHWK